jgi:hypothetical protein
VDINNRKEIITSLSDYLLSTIKFGDDYPRRVISLEIPVNKAFSKVIKSIHIYKIENNQSEHIILSSFDNNELTKEVISDCVESKEKRLKVYKQSCNEIWLLMVLPTMFFSNDYVLLEEVKKTSFSSNFDKLLILDEYRSEMTIF